ncbi:hypothetical protein ACM66B_000849 [Microbotryomycetes sp. NB124-2]
MFDDVYDTLRLSQKLKDVLPSQLPLQPTAILVSAVVAVSALVALAISCLAMHCTKKLAFLGKVQPRCRKTALYAGSLSTLVGVVVAGILHVQVKKSVDEFNALRQGEAAVGNGFAQLWAGLSLELFTVLLLLAESYTKG